MSPGGKSSGNSRGVKGLEREREWLRLVPSRYGKQDFHTRPLPKGDHLVTSGGLKVLIGRENGLEKVPL